MTRNRIVQAFGIVAFAAWAAACSDSGTELDTSTIKQSLVTSVVAYAPEGQTAQTGAAVVSAPAVLVKDGNGNGLSGIPVTFAVVQGGGSLGATSVVTNSQGIATAGSWTLGATAGTNEVSATVSNLTPVRFTAVGIAPVVNNPSGSGFNISTRFVANVSTRQREAVNKAVARWQSVITSDLYNIPVSAPAGTCFAAQPVLNETVDDILIFVEFVNIDGVGKTLGEAGPCYIRSDNSLPIVGHLKLDAADLAQMETIGTIDDVVLHEMGHILGIGTLWPEKSLLNGQGTANPLFTGTGALSAFRGMGGLDSGVPVENTGEAGTRDSHWRETVFGNELMTGWISGSVNPISAVTVASLQDLGYGANAGAASTFTLGGTTSGVVGTPIDLDKHERVIRPKYQVDRQGRRFKLPALDL